ncbi:phosphonate ABC transporter, permease protein PhnE [Undibacterium sp. Jales W-56]|uniref:phosphonate ABC transporter, permease protein PhnE n=1 Tax=Undibacterium sp. Jales W-56 TaxID=2897325 RepID=UPI0021CF25A0|nr:phosphonate ABC transporter, permease protein PhnE [Undibacterium sp. Jales W-56]MCU6435509.1 phosphonate ABC transporter, permease protein PhnE [Undibacterium sp. Jales W-56]
MSPAHTTRAALPLPPKRLSWSLAVIVCLSAILIISSFYSLKINWSALFSDAAIKTSREFLQGFAPPDLSPSLLKKTFFAAFETLAMSALGTFLAAAAGLCLALPASGRFGIMAMRFTRLLLNVARAIPELVWASIMLIAAGLGPFAGTIALAAHTAGVLGRLFAEALENAPHHAAATLRINGAGILSSFLYATLPQALPQMLSYTLYRWENNIRAAAILGVVGAGGLGQMLKYHLSLFQMQTAATVIIAMLLLVAMVDALSFALRRWLVR